MTMSTAETAAGSVVQTSKRNGEHNDHDKTNSGTDLYLQSWKTVWRKSHVVTVTACCGYL